MKAKSGSLADATAVFARRREAENAQRRKRIVAIDAGRSEDAIAAIVRTQTRDDKIDIGRPWQRDRRRR